MTWHRLWRTVFGPIVLAVGTVIIGAAIGNAGSAIYEIVLYWLQIIQGKGPDTDWDAWIGPALYWALLFWGALAIFLLMLVAYIRKILLPLRSSLRRKASGEARAIVIMGLSYAEIVTSADGAFDLDANKKLKTLVAVGFDKASGSVPEALASGLLTLGPNGRPERDSPSGHTWVQNLRALRPHVQAGKLAMVVVCPSRETAAQANHFKQFLEQILPPRGDGGIEVRINPVHPDYSSFEDVQNALLEAKKLALRHFGSERYGDRDICIDATSGTAAFSIAAGIVTLNHDMIYSYVTTLESGPPAKGGEPRFYDAHLDFAAFIPD